MNAIPTNRNLARLMAEVADDLAEYNHLPALSSVSIHGDGHVNAYTQGFALWGQRGLAAWAEAFEALITLDMSLASPFARCRVEIGGRTVELITDILASDAQRVATHAGVELSAGGRARVSAEQFLTALEPAAVTG